MARINSCLKRTFITFNLFFAIIGGVVIGLAMLSQILTKMEEGPAMENRTTGLVVLYVLGASTMLIALLGAYGAFKEHKVSLIVFLVLMVIGALLMIRMGIPVAAVKPQLEDGLKERFSRYLPLDQASEEVKHIADNLQTQLHCCGLFSYSDWNNNIPNSCSCKPTLEENCQKVGYRRSPLYYFEYQTESNEFVYRKPCFPIILHYVLLGFDITMGIIFTLASLAVVGLILSSIMVHQLRRPTTHTVLLSVPTIFTPGPPKYQELQNPPPKYEELQNPPLKYEELQNPPPPY